MKIKDNLTYEIDWRIQELAYLKTNHLLNKISDTRKNVICKYSVVAIYALLEGFVVKSMQLYLCEINSLKLHKQEIDLKIINSYVSKEYKLHDLRVNIDKQVDLLTKLEVFYSNDIIILNNKIETEANVNLKVLNKILYTYNLELIDNNEIKDGLNKLLMFRNSIAHGEVALNVTNTIIQELSATVVKAMDLIMDRIIDGLKNKTYLRINN